MRLATEQPTAKGARGVLDRGDQAHKVDRAVLVVVGDGVHGANATIATAFNQGGEELGERFGRNVAEADRGTRVVVMGV